ncbi:c-type cytochrome [Croceibacter atlanticus]|jgi:mono/diheme cytochrome c family protein|uniref:Probable major anaerobically induced outer membrane transmembrane protein n=1 Tax=Croceibacter atlanticus (strain ATCC BAA-628 / JCM 21780 / CIP 108009 / IAM 15332 / KCTC 12090 / HTCC2559) TaxID=216432 RepID=A3UAI9_CROAH|nr:cytochrome c [Croceibacter atlanticus]EAP86825.1 probable major anaerobically induced outer membrane transmembrane protein [Croceibacter atlanticus HTCC2559]MBW4970675.1 cytochrome c [Croceibacter atlanticus]
MKYSILICVTVFSLLSCKNETQKTETSLIPESEKTFSQESPLEQSIKRGEAVYIDFCKRCHMPNGKGVGTTYPPLAGSNWLEEKRKESIHSVKYGLNGEIQVNGKTYNNVMTPLGLSDDEVADVMNYVMNSWGNTQETMVTEDEVSAIKK